MEHRSLDFLNVTEDNIPMVISKLWCVIAKDAGKTHTVRIHSDDDMDIGGLSVPENISLDFIKSGNRAKKVKLTDTSE